MSSMIKIEEQTRALLRNAHWMPYPECALQRLPMPKTSGMHRLVRPELRKRAVSRPAAAASILVPILGMGQAMNNAVLVSMIEKKSAVEIWKNSLCQRCRYGQFGPTITLSASQTGPGTHPRNPHNTGRHDQISAENETCSAC